MNIIHVCILNLVPMYISQICSHVYISDLKEKWVSKEARVQLKGFMEQLILHSFTLKF